VVEYWITNVKFDNNKIKEVRALMSTIEGLSNPVRYSKEKIVKSIEKTADKWYTSILKETRGARNIWERSARIQIVNIDGEKIIRTDGNKTKVDNLGELLHLK
jgi:hypothetical protein